MGGEQEHETCAARMPDRGMPGSQPLGRSDLEACSPAGQWLASRTSRNGDGAGYGVFLVGGFLAGDFFTGGGGALRPGLAVGRGVAFGDGGGGVGSTAGASSGSSSLAVTKSGGGPFTAR